MLLEFLAVNGKFSRERLMSRHTLQWILLRPVLFCTVLFEREREREREREKYGCKLDTMTVTGLDDVPDGQSVRGGLAANNVRNKVAEYFLQMLERFPGKCKKNEQ